MPNYALLPVISCALVLLTAGVNYGLGQMDVPRPHRLPVETFPATVGAWKGGALQAVDIDVQKKLPSAKIVERIYTNPQGQWVDLMLLTATEDEDMHSPQACFPSQGWTLSNIQETQVGGQPATRMSAQQEGGPPATVLYWLTGYYPPVPPRNALLQKAYEQRTRVMGNHNNMSLFVRMIGSDTPLGRRAMAEFTSQVDSPLQALVGKGAQQSQKSLLHRGF